MVNIKNYTSTTPADSKEVLGATTKEVSDEDFWKEFLNENPNYVPGWIEIGKIDKAREISPNIELTR